MPKAVTTMLLVLLTNGSNVRFIGYFYVTLLIVTIGGLEFLFNFGDVNKCYIHS